jgi:hypothetical protein
MPSIYQFVRCWIYHAETVGAFVRWRAIFIQPGRHSRRAAQRNKQSPSIRRGVNAARPFAHWKGSDDAVCGSINHRDIAGAFIAYKHKIAWRLSARHTDENDPEGPKGKQAMHMRDAYVSIPSGATGLAKL